MKWYLMQLLPLKYHTIYEEKGQKHYVQWRMWFGRQFAINDRVI
ncbi:hypothetical protein [Paenalkalicoccus suaedae]|nr:hypothetical protein [Paenalkalicoccus suaedae]